jgi:glycerol-3-phosphate acyltransferase PlsY
MTLSPWTAYVVAALSGYLLGSIPSALWIGRGLARTDVRAHGSGNLGATNVYRVLGARIALVVLLADAGKGLLAVLAQRVVWAGAGTDGSGAGAGLSGNAGVVAGLFAVLGHMWTCFASFRGGKGVATAAGVFLALAPLATLLDILVWGAAFALTRTVSIASIAAAALLLPALFVTGVPSRPAGPAVAALGGAIAALVLWRHRANMGRILRGEEKALTRGRPGEMAGTGKTR